MSKDTDSRTEDVANVSWPRWVGVCLLCAYIIAMFLPAMNATPHIGGGMDVEDTLWGWEAFLISFLLIHIPVYLANPLFVYGVIKSFRGNDVAAAVCGGIATLLALFWPVLSLLAKQPPPPCLRMEIFGVGYWLWLSCMIALFLTGSIRYSQRRHENV